MQHSQAVEMLSGSHWNLSENQFWADLGCGSGTFTLALAHHLAPGSRIIAVDKDRDSLNQIIDQFQQVAIEKRAADFTDEDFSPSGLDGILMANSLHFVRNQAAFIEKIKQFLKPGGAFLIVEYDMESANPWVPYPISFNRLNELFPAAGFSSIQKLNEKSSRYNRADLYSVLIRCRD